MKRLTPEQTATLKDWFRPERPGPLIGTHVIHTGHGACWVEHWPASRAVLVETAGNYTLLGEPQALAPADLRPHVRGFVDAPETFLPLLQAAFPDLVTWPRVIFVEQDSPVPVAAAEVPVRRLEPFDAQHLRGLGPESAWVGKTWGGADGLAASGCAWGAFVDGQLASVACTFFLGERYEDIGVVTEPGFRGMGLSTACAAALCRDIRARGHRASWTTSTDNLASLRVAEKLGFAVQRHDRLYVVGIPLPKPAEPPGAMHFPATAALTR